MIPQSTTPSWTYSGTSAARTSRTSTGALRQGKASARSPGCSGPSPASSSSETDGSRRRPLTGTAIFRRSTLAAFVPVERQPVAALAVAEPVRHPRHRRRRGVRLAARPPGRASPGRRAAPPPSGAPSPPARRSCRGPAGSAPPPPATRAPGSPPRALCISRVRHECRPCLPSVAHLPLSMLAR